MTTCLICGKEKKPTNKWPAYNLCSNKECRKEYEYRQILHNEHIPQIFCK